MKMNTKKILLLSMCCMFSFSLVGCDKKASDDELGEIKIIDEKDEIASDEKSESFDFTSEIDGIFKVTEKYQKDSSFYDFISSYNTYMGTSYSASGSGMVSTSLGTDKLSYLIDEPKNLYVDINEKKEVSGSGIAIDYTNIQEKYSELGTNPDWSEFKKTSGKELLVLSYITIPNLNKYELESIYSEYNLWIDSIDLSKQSTESKEIQRKGFKVLFSRKGNYKINITFLKV